MAKPIQQEVGFFSPKVSQQPALSSSRNGGLDEMLHVFHLTRTTLTMRALTTGYRNCARQMHPDRSKSNSGSYQRMKMQYDALSIFLSATACEEFFSTGTSDIVNIITQIRNKNDQCFLLEKLEKTLGDEANRVHAEHPVFVDATKHMLQLVLKLHQENKLPFMDALNLMSRTAKLLHHPEEHKAFFDAACDYNLVSSKLSAWMMVIAGYLAKMVTFGCLGNAWVKLGSEQLEQTLIVEKLATESQKHYSM